MLHPPRKYPNSPILPRGKPWEKWVADAGQILFDPKAGIYKRWYRTFAKLGNEMYSDRGSLIFHCYAHSENGIQWKKPNLSLVEFAGNRNNNIIPTRYHIVPIRHDAGNDKQFAGLQGRGGENLFFSEDGLNWEPHPDNPVAGGPSFGMTAVLFDPERQMYAAYGQGWVRLPRPDEPDRGSRVVSGRFSKDLINWTVPSPVLIPSADDPAGFEFYAMGAYMDGDLYIGLPWSYRSSYGLGNDPPMPRQHGPIETELAVSRDGRHWTRVAPRQGFIPSGAEGEWDSGMVLTGAPVQMGNQIYFYYSAWDGHHGEKRRKAAGGLAILDRDRYLSLTTDDQGQSGHLITVVLQPGTGQLWINADATGGQIRVALLTPEGQPIPGFGLHECEPLIGNTTQHEVQWNTGSQLPRKTRFRIEFSLEGKAHLYGFGAR